MQLKEKIDFLSNMGLRYTAFRITHEIKVRFGLMTSIFPTHPKFIEPDISLEEWKKTGPDFFFNSKEALTFAKAPKKELQSGYNDILNGVFTFFSKEKYNLGKSYNWITNPVTGYQYELKHWSKIQDLSKKAGDIKYVWEKARFSFLYDIIRYDYHFDKDCASVVFNEIDSFIEKNPINLGPNYKCSQETSLRILNWTFALYYYKNSKELTELRFKRILNSIYWQLHHVYHNINFSRIAVRNNHALTETLMLFLSGLLFPFLPNTKKWGEKGKKWFEQEIAYQIYEDGTFLQFSMNYHRVAIQLLTWAIILSEKHQNKFNEIVYQRARKSLEYLRECQDSSSGTLPNYGANDGALFFKLTSDDYRVYTSQLNDLNAVLDKKVTKLDESQHWYGFSDLEISKIHQNELNTFKKGGYYIINENDAKTFIKCGEYKDRPSQSDNLHIDIWYKGINYLWDTGSYKYNTEEKYTSFFSGCEGHNTISVSDKNQMKKGSRFIWHFWVRKAWGKLSKDNNYYIFKGGFKGFKELGHNIAHQRIVTKTINTLKWEINDVVKNADDRDLKLYWHLNPKVLDTIKICCEDLDGNKLLPLVEQKWSSNYYGSIDDSTRYTFSSKKGFNTTIKIITK